MVKIYKRNKKSVKKLTKQSRRRCVRTKVSKKRMVGGVSFNQFFNSSDIPSSDRYEVNNYSNDVSRGPYLQDARLMSGGGRGCTKKYGGRLKRTFRKKAGRLQKGGMSFTNDLLLGSAPVGPVGNFFTSGRTDSNFFLSSSGTASVPGGIVPYDINMPRSNMPVLV
jgi:hypothetical protein